MVMSMQGTVYVATSAYSHWGKSSLTMTSNLCTDVSGPIEDGLRTAPKAGPVSTAAELQDSGHGHGHDKYYYISNTRSVYMGKATIIMGVINGMAGQHKEKWDEGVFEYVPYFEPLPGYDPIPPADVTINPSYPWVRDRTYKLTFYRGAKY
jgi:hypothetical protein